MLTICYLEEQINHYTKKLSLLKWQQDFIEDCYNEGGLNKKYFKKYKQKAEMEREDLQDQLDKCFIEIQRMKKNNPFSKQEST